MMLKEICFPVNIRLEVSISMTLTELLIWRYLSLSLNKVRPGEQFTCTTAFTVFWCALLLSRWLGDRTPVMMADCTDVGAEPTGEKRSESESKALGLLLNLSFDTHPCYKPWSHKKGITATWYRDEICLRGGWHLFIWGVQQSQEELSIDPLLRIERNPLEVIWVLGEDVAWAFSLQQCPSHNLLGRAYWADLGPTGVISGPRMLWDPTSWNVLMLAVLLCLSCCHHIPN